MWRNLNEDEIESFKQWARNNYQPGNEIEGTWHPVIQLECALINFEYLSIFSKVEMDDLKEQVNIIINHWRKK